MASDNPERNESHPIDFFHENAELDKSISKWLPMLNDKTICIREEAAEGLSELAADHAELREVLLPLLLRHSLKEKQWCIINNNILFHIGFIPKQHSEWVEHFLSAYIELAKTEDERVFSAYVVRDFALGEIWEFIRRKRIKINHPKLGNILMLVSDGLNRISLEEESGSKEALYMLKIKEWYEGATGELIDLHPAINTPVPAKILPPSPVKFTYLVEDNDQLPDYQSPIRPDILTKKENGSQRLLPENNVSNTANDLIGLESVKLEIEQTINEIKYQKLLIQQGERPVSMSRHMVFTGNPGTGKTTIARILSKIYKSLGVLSKGHLVETDRAGLVAGYLGQTAIRTDEVISSALGGVLFIDEAYALTTLDRDMYGQEAVDTLLKRMEDNRDDLIVIVAGYPSEMERFINANPGLRSRFTKYLHFDDYNAIELEQIFNALLKSSGHEMASDSGNHLAEVFREMDRQRGEKFGNGRTVRNLYERTIRNVASRVIKTMPSNIKQVLPEDLTIDDVHAVLRINAARSALIH